MSNLIQAVGRDECQERLEQIFPRDAFPSAMSGQNAAAAVAGLIWAGCVMSQDDDELLPGLPYARPTTTLWMNPALIAINDDAKRSAWYAASIRSKKRSHALMAEWRVETAQWYADNTRETVRDDIFHPWAEQGAMFGAPHVPTTSGAPRWILRRSFAELFAPTLTGSALESAIEIWTTLHMSASGRVRANLARARAQAAVNVSITLPGGNVRDLAPGNSSVLIRGVIEGWAALRLKDPAVLAISESAVKLNAGDVVSLESSGIAIDASRLLPDILLVDLDTEPLNFWIVEVVATDGPITERRKRLLIRWAEGQGIPADQLFYLTAFLSRHHAAAKKALPTLAAGTAAWFLDEPEFEMAWSPIASQIPNNVVPLGTPRQAPVIRER